MGDMADMMIDNAINNALDDDFFYSSGVSRRRRMQYSRDIENRFVHTTYGPVVYVNRVKLMEDTLLRLHMWNGKRVRNLDDSHVSAIIAWATGQGYEAVVEYFTEVKRSRMVDDFEDL